MMCSEYWPSTAPIIGVHIKGKGSFISCYMPNLPGIIVLFIICQNSIPAVKITWISYIRYIIIQPQIIASKTKQPGIPTYFSCDLGDCIIIVYAVDVIHIFLAHNYV